MALSLGEMPHKQLSLKCLFSRSSNRRSTNSQVARVHGPPRRSTGTTVSEPSLKKTDVSEVINWIFFFFQNSLGFVHGYHKSAVKTWRPWPAITEQCLRLPQNMDSNLPAYSEVWNTEWRFNFRDTFPHQNTLLFQFTDFQFKWLLLFMCMWRT